MLPINPEDLARSALTHAIAFVPTPARRARRGAATGIRQRPKGCCISATGPIRSPSACAAREAAAGVGAEAFERAHGNGGLDPALRQGTVQAVMAARLSCGRPAPGLRVMEAATAP